MELIKHLQKLEAYPRINKNLKDFYKRFLMFSIGLAVCYIIIGGPVFTCLGYIFLSIPGFYEHTPLVVLFIPSTFLESQVSSSTLSNNICFLILSLLVAFENTRDYKLWILAGFKTCFFLFVQYKLDILVVYIFLVFFFLLIKVEIFIRKDFKRFYKLGNKLTNYMNCFKFNPGAVVLDEEYKILESNEGIEELIEGKEIVGRIFPKFLDGNYEKRFRSIVKGGSAEGVLEFEAVLKSGKSALFSIKFLQHNEKQILLLFCTNINEYTQFRAIVKAELIKTLNTIKTCKYELEEIFQGNLILRNEILINYREFHYNVYSLNLFLSQFSSTIDFNSETFNFVTELELLIDNLFPKASSKGLEISFQKGNGINEFVETDKNKYTFLIASLLKLLIEESQPFSVVNVKIQVIVRFIQKSTPKETIVSFNFSFVPEYILVSEIETLFSVREDSKTRKGIGKLFYDFTRYGIDFVVFDMVLNVMKGYVHHIHKKEGTYSTLAFSLVLSFECAKEVEETPFVLFPLVRTGSIEGVKWIPNRPKDEFAQFEHEIKLIENMSITTIETVEVDPSIVEDVYLSNLW